MFGDAVRLGPSLRDERLSQRHVLDGLARVPGRRSHAVREADASVLQRVRRRVRAGSSVHEHGVQEVRARMLGVLGRVLYVAHRIDLRRRLDLSVT